MSRGVWRQQQLPVRLMMVVFLAFVYLTPIAATAQEEIASPVVPEPTATTEPTATGESQFGAAAEAPTAAFDQPSYSLIQGESVQMVLTITYSSEFSTPNTLTINNPFLPEFDFTVVSAVASSAAITCSVSGALPSTTVTGTVSATGPGTCVVTLNVTTNFFTLPGPFKTSRPWFRGSHRL